LRELSDIVTSLLDMDGSCRDLNFEGPTWEGVKDLLDSLESAFGEVSGTDQEGKVLTAPFRDFVLAVAENRGYLHLIFNAGTGLIRNLQVFICSVSFRRAGLDRLMLKIKTARRKLTIKSSTIDYL
jgi:hypothetical protein